MVRTYFIIMPIWFVSHFARRREAQEIVFVFCLFAVTPWNVKVCAHDFAIIVLKYKSGFGTVGRGRFKQLSMMLLLGLVLGLEG